METNAPLTITSAGFINSGAARIEKSTPDRYRLVRYGNQAELVLQGAYRWEQGFMNGYEWRDIKTVDL